MFVTVKEYGTFSSNFLKNGRLRKWNIYPEKVSNSKTSLKLA